MVAQKGYAACLGSAIQQKIILEFTGLENII